MLNFVDNRNLPSLSIRLAVVEDAFFIDSETFGSLRFGLRNLGFEKRFVFSKLLTSHFLNALFSLLLFLGNFFDDILGFFLFEE